MAPSFDPPGTLVAVDRPSEPAPVGGATDAGAAFLAVHEGSLSGVFEVREGWEWD